MAWKKNYRRRYRKKRPAKKVATRGYVKRVLDRQIEDKWLNPNNGPSGFSTTGTISLLNAIAQGDTVSNRIGNRIKMKSLNMHIQMSTSPGVSNMVRFLLVYDKQTNTVVPSVNQILITPDYLSPTNPDYFSRFTVIRDITLPIEIQGGGTDVSQNKKLLFNVRLNKMTHYLTGGSTITDIMKGSLYLVSIAQLPTAGSATEGYTFNGRLIYEDA